MNPDELFHIIRNRRAIYPASYTEVPIDKDKIELLLEAANWAPSHKRTEPWRFRVLRGNAKIRFADFAAQAYQDITPPEKWSANTRDKIVNNIHRADTIIMINFYRDAAMSVPEWEEIAALGASIQNMWLMTAALGLGGYWSTPGWLQTINAGWPLAEGELCKGIFYLAHHAAPDLPGQRGSVEDKVIWEND